MYFMVDELLDGRRIQASTIKVMKPLSGLLLLIAAIGIPGCVYQTRLHTPMQPDGWNAQPLTI